MKVLKKLNVLWRKALKRIYKIPIRTHNKLLSIIYEKRSLNACLAKRIIKFYYQMINSDNCIVRTVARLCRHQHISNMGRNLTYIDSICNIMSEVEKNDCLSCILHDV